MIYQRLYNGNVILHSLSGSPPHPLHPKTTAPAVARHLLQQMHCPQSARLPSQLWDLAQLLLQDAQNTLTAAAAAAQDPAKAKADRADKVQAKKHAPASGQENAAAAPASSGTILQLCCVVLKFAARHALKVSLPQACICSACNYRPSDLA